jgi:cytochrome P450 family 142 subfamily A polypeptide 1
MALRVGSANRGDGLNEQDGTDMKGPVAKIAVGPSAGSGSESILRSPSADQNYLDASAWDVHFHERTRWLRENEPVRWSAKSDLFLISKYDDIVEISKDPALFCSGQGIRPGIPIRQALIDEDDPKHCQLRRTINRGFTPRMVKRLEEKFEAITTRAIDRIATHGQCDFVSSIAVPLPLHLIAEMIGIPESQRENFHAWSDAMLGADGHYDDPEIMGRAAGAAQAYSALVGEIIEKRRDDPQDDLISALVGAKEDGLIENFDLESSLGAGDIADTAERAEAFLELANDELVMVLITLMVAGNETTRNALSGCVEILIRHPEIRDQLVAKPEVIPQAVEEFLRIVSPVHSFARTATRDTTLHGQRIEAGQKVLMLYPAGNRDEDVFESADEIRIDRNPNHVAFGVGHHFCLGANLARMELRTALRELLRRLPDMAFSSDGPVIESHALIRSCRRMDIQFSPE